MSTEPFYRPMKPAARIIWTVVTLAAAWFAGHHYLAALAAI